MAVNVEELRREYRAQRDLPDGLYSGPLRCESGLDLPHDPRVQTVYYPCGKPGCARVDGKVYCRQHAKRAAVTP